MKSMVIIALAAVSVCIPMTNAMDIGVFGSYWDPKDDDEVWGGGVLLLPGSLPIEIRGTYYEKSSTHELESIPVDVGLNFQFTRNDKLNVTAVGGASYYFLDISDRDLDNEFGWYAGARISLNGPRGNALFGEAIYRGADFDEDVKLDFSGWAFNVGFIF